KLYARLSGLQKSYPIGREMPAVRWSCLIQNARNPAFSLVPIWRDLSGFTRGGSACALSEECCGPIARRCRRYRVEVCPAANAIDRGSDLDRGRSRPPWMPSSNNPLHRLGQSAPDLLQSAKLPKAARAHALE